MIKAARRVPLNRLIPGASDKLLVQGVALDSRVVEPGDLFMAIPGHLTDGRRYISDALSRGAVAVACQAGEKDQHSSEKVIIVDDLPSKVGEIASRFYDIPSAKLSLIGVTGTNGKTSCCHYLAQCLTDLGVTCGVIGTMGYGLGNSWCDLERTTPDAVVFQRCLAELLELGARTVSFEASSHGLAQGRLDGTFIDIAVFTNLSRDHLDYHSDLDDYFESKRSLFQLPGLKNVVINADDLQGQRLIDELGSQVEIISYGIENTLADVFCTECLYDPTGTTARIRTPWGSGVLSSRLLGEFNLSNLLAVVAVLGARGYGLADITAAVSGVRHVKGRMDLLQFPNRADVVVDYAHTPDALNKVLEALRDHCRGSLWCLFGCGGDRDRGKRKLMGEIAYDKSDVLVLTSDNPRSEPSEQIVADILKGVGDSKPVIVELDRSKAIKRAIDELGKNDMLLVAGKGHENYQETHGRRVPYSDYEEIQRAME